MAKIEVYKCSVCGNIIEVLHVGGGTLTCCDQPMNLQAENTVDASLEKHVPKVAKSKGSLEVVVGSVLHPMEDKHYIQWIEVITPTKLLRKVLKPGDAPKAHFLTDEPVVKVREYCNLHGLWAAK